MMDDGDDEITINDAHDIARWVVGDDGSSHPLIGKEDKLLEALLCAQRAHREALELDSFRHNQVHAVTRLRNALQNALDALDDTPVNLAFFDPDLDERYTDPNSKRDLRALLCRALEFLKDNGEVSDLMNRQDQDGKLPRAIRSHPQKVKSVGLRAVVESLFEFWDRETDLPFSDDFEKPLNSDGNEGILVPKGLAAKFVFFAAFRIDPNYTAQACSNAMRPR